VFETFRHQLVSPGWPVKAQLALAGDAQEAVGQPIQFHLAAQKTVQAYNREMQLSAPVILVLIPFLASMPALIQCRAASVSPWKRSQQLSVFKARNCFCTWLTRRASSLLQVG
jgi:hypothetical protein